MNKSRYFKWLRQLVKCDDDKYGDLMVALFNKQFYWTIAMDENRAEDGKQLRDLYLDRHSRAKSCEFRDDPCSVLEMMIALSRRWMVDIESDDGSEEGFETYFWEMISNLGLSGARNGNFNPVLVDDILTKLLDRDYSCEGIGGLFPLHTKFHNQRNSEIWYQLQAYLAEKGDF